MESSADNGPARSPMLLAVRVSSCHGNDRSQPARPNTVGRNSTPRWRTSVLLPRQGSDVMQQPRRFELFAHRARARSLGFVPSRLGDCRPGDRWTTTWFQSPKSPPRPFKNENDLVATGASKSLFW